MNHDPATTLILDVESRGLRPELGETTFAVATAWLSEPSRISVYWMDSASDIALLLADISRATAYLNHHLVFDLRQLIRTLNLPVDTFSSRGQQWIDTRVRAHYCWPHLHWRKKDARKKGGGGPFSLKSLTAGAANVPGDEAALKAHLKQAALEEFRPIIGTTKAGKPRRRACPPELKDAMKAAQHDYSRVPRAILTPYLVGDIVRAYLLYKQTSTMLTAATPGTLAQLALDEALLPAILRMELRGLRLNPVELDNQIAALRAQAHDIRKGLPFNPSKRKELVEFYGAAAERAHMYGNIDPKTGFRKLKLDKHNLQRLGQMGEPHIDRLLRLRLHEKRLGTYATVWKRWATGCGRVHCYINTDGTTTGRMSSSGPNLQNIPKEPGGMKRTLQPDPGTVWLCADWVTMEYFGAAHLSADKTMLADCRTGDVHAETARVLFPTYDAESKDRRKQLRGAGKAFNFARLYGASDWKLRKQLEIATGDKWTDKQVSDAATVYRGRYPGLNSWASATVRIASEGVTCEDPFGRRHQPMKARPYAMTNHLVQGFCAGVMKRALLRLHEMGLDLLMVIHDEFVCQVPDDHHEVARVADTMRRVMSSVEGWEFPCEITVAPSNFDEKRALRDWIDERRIACAPIPGPPPGPTGGPSSVCGPSPSA